MMCPECGNKLSVQVLEQRTQLVSCIGCNWNIATTYHAPIEQDETNYCIYVPSQFLTVQQLRLISQLSGMNYIQVKKRVKEGAFLVFEGQALKVLRIKKKLKKRGVCYTITPNFDY